MNEVVIIGGGFSGLLTALILSKQVQKVHIIERRSFEDSFKQNVPQAKHIHILSKKGLSLLSELCPDFTIWAKKYCLPELEFTKEIQWLGPHGQFPQYDSNFGKIFSFDRPVLDHLLIEQLTKKDNVFFHFNTSYQHINKESISNPQTKVQLSNGKLILADLLIFATGRRVKLKSLLESLGARGLKEKSISSNLRYRSFYIETNYFKNKTSKAIMITTFGKLRPYGTLIFPTQSDKCRYIVTQVAQKFPTSAENFSKYLHSPVANEIIKDASFLSSPIEYKLDGSYRLLTNKIQHWPKGVICLGDSVCYLNPIFAQGLTMSLLFIKNLKIALKNPEKDWEKQYMKKLDKLISTPWIMGTIEDRKINSSFVSRLWIKLAEIYLSQYLRAATRSPTLYLRYLHVVHMLRSPWHIFNPKNLIKILKSH